DDSFGDRPDLPQSESIARDESGHDQVGMEKNHWHRRYVSRRDGAGFSEHQTAVESHSVEFEHAPEHRIRSSSLATSFLAREEPNRRADLGPRIRRHSRLRATFGKVVPRLRVIQPPPAAEPADDRSSPVLRSSVQNDMRAWMRTAAPRRNRARRPVP